MKKLYTLLLFINACSTGNAQNIFPTTGNVGIGTTNPSVKLEVIDNGGIQSVGGPLNARTHPGVPDENIDNPESGILKTNGFLSNDGGFYHRRAFWGQSIDFRAGNIQNSQRNVFRIRRYDGGSMWTEVFRISENGNVGISTSSPQAKLAVNGSILAKEVKVKTDITVPDYVFEEDYPLLSLTELNNYVKQHKHLPEVPSAAEIGEKGLDLASMNLLLLKKVEELTLYLIKQNQINKEQNQLIEQQQTALNRLEELVKSNPAFKQEQK